VQAVAYLQTGGAGFAVNKNFKHRKTSVGRFEQRL
jgi:hypothetical protein